jgi:hypothetical protein
MCATRIDIAICALGLCNSHMCNLYKEANYAQNSGISLKKILVRGMWHAMCLYPNQPFDQIVTGFPADDECGSESRI